MDDLSEWFEPVRAAWREGGWPGVEESLSYGTVALKVRGKLMARMREPNVLVLRCELDEKEFLMLSAPEVYFETDHYKGWPAILVRLSEIDPEELKMGLEKAWRINAPKRLVSEFDRSQAV